jgi:hypothetical protein
MASGNTPREDRAMNLREHDAYAEYLMRLGHGRAAARERAQEVFEAEHARQPGAEVQSADAVPVEYGNRLITKEEKTAALTANGYTEADLAVLPSWALEGDLEL